MHLASGVISIEMNCHKSNLLLYSVFVAGSTLVY